MALDICTGERYKFLSESHIEVFCQIISFWRISD
jgi:hypothetical protein